MRTIVTALLAAFALAASASAQTAPNPVLEHFRAYRAAIAQGDLAAADTAASAALAASEARDGDGGRTAVLALNLASLRLERGDRDGALAPATRAHTLATSRADTDVDPLLARLVLARAALTETPESKDQLSALLSEAASRDDLAGEAYLAAIDLGRRERTDLRHTQSAAAWLIAAETAKASPGDAQLARADALIASAISLIHEADTHEAPIVQQFEIDAVARLREAIGIANAARSEHYTPGGSVDRATLSLATAIAWIAALESRLGTLDRPWANMPPIPLRWDRATSGETCRAHTDMRPRVRFPTREGNMRRIGAVVGRFQTDATGRIIQREIVAAAPNAESRFAHEVRESMRLWNVDWEPGAACNKEMEIFWSITFAIE
jgi:hypothetical protein